jgi:hypothetical protein
MIIEEEDFRLIPVDNCSNIFDLEILYTTNKGKENESQKFKNVAYGIPLESAIKRISNFRIGNKYPNSIDLKTYLKEFKTIVDNIKEMCNA